MVENTPFLKNSSVPATGGLQPTAIGARGTPATSSAFDGRAERDSGCVTFSRP